MIEQSKLRWGFSRGVSNLSKVDSWLEKKVEAEVWGTSKITNKTNKNALGFILFVVFHTPYKSVALLWPPCYRLSVNISTGLKNTEAGADINAKDSW